MITKPRTIRNPSRNSDLVVQARKKAEQAEVRIVLIVLVSFLLGAAAAAFWISRPRVATAPEAQNQNLNQPAGLSESTKTVLSRLLSPVEIRYYAVLDPSSDPDSLRVFAKRVDELLVSFQREANGKISLTRSNSQSYANAKAALSDGIKPFNEEKGEPSFLGIAFVNKDRKASLAQLSPEWETALESDISRAILRTISTDSSPRVSSPTASRADAISVEEVKRLVPNIDSVSLADATRMLREASFKDFAAAASQFQTQLKEAQEGLKAAQNGGSEAEQQAAMKNLQQVQAEQTERLKAIAAKSQAQIDALKQLKSGGQ
jgi:hypothetical protein